MNFKGFNLGPKVWRKKSGGTKFAEGLLKAVGEGVDDYKELSREKDKEARAEKATIRAEERADKRLRSQEEREQSRWESRQGTLKEIRAGEAATKWDRDKELANIQFLNSIQEIEKRHSLDLDATKAERERTEAALLEMGNSMLKRFGLSDDEIKEWQPGLISSVKAGKVTNYISAFDPGQAQKPSRKQRKPLVRNSAGQEVEIPGAVWRDWTAQEMQEFEDGLPEGVTITWPTDGEYTAGQKKDIATEELAAAGSGSDSTPQTVEAALLRYSSSTDTDLKPMAEEALTDLKNGDIESAREKLAIIQDIKKM